MKRYEDDMFIEFSAKIYCAQLKNLRESIYQASQLAEWRDLR